MDKIGGKVSEEKLMIEKVHSFKFYFFQRIGDLCSSCTDKYIDETG
jgi:hypothetical protein